MKPYSQNEAGPALVLAAGVRTPWVRAGGVFAKEDAAHLGALASREVLARAGLDPADLDEVLTGCVGPPFDQANVSRVLALRAGVPWSVTAKTLGRNCASGMEAVTSAVTAASAGLGSAFLCVGLEHMSGYPLVVGRKMTGLFARLAKARSPGAKLSALTAFRPSWLAPRIALLEGLVDPVSGLIMGSTAELLARDWGISRDDADQFAAESHGRAQRSREAGRLAQEIMPVLPLGAREPSGVVNHDDGIRDGQSVEALAKLRPYFEKPDGVVTVGNACGISDGACALLVCTEDLARERGIEPLARIRSWAWAGLDPSRMGLGPVYSSAIALDAAGCSLSDIGVVELNEAFAVQVLACARAFESDDFARDTLGRDKAVGVLDLEKTNPNGGAIALGHPVGATGARLLLSAALELKAADTELALATLCIGGGQGGAVVLERV